MNTMSKIISLCLLTTLTACGGRVAAPIALEQNFDNRLECTHLIGEFDNNTYRLNELLGESKDKVAKNIGMLLSSPLFLDMSDTQKKEATAINARNGRLRTLMQKKSCANIPALPK